MRFVPLAAALAVLAAATLAAPSTAAAHDYELNAATDRPSLVKQARFLTLVDRSGEHWGQRSVGRTGRRPGARDGHNVVGFTTEVDSGIGGQTYCFDGVIHVHRGGRRHEHCVERDILINPRVLWEQGPRHPSSEEYDLETVLLHEFGHFSGNWPREGRRCTNSPMASPLYNGEWWRSRRDFRWIGCGSARGSAFGSLTAIEL